MKTSFLFIIIGLIVSCQSSQTDKQKPTPKLDLCNSSRYDTLLVHTATSFTATHINLDSSLKKTPNVRQAIGNPCFSTSKASKYFVTRILLEQYRFQLKEAHQGFNLLAMKTGDASVVIDKFVSLVGARFGKGEMLNSGYVLELYEIDPDLKNDQRLKGIVSQIEILQLEIERGFD